MGKAETTEKCAHPPCECVARNMGGYCSDQCRDAQGGDQIECRCGHPGCE